MNNNTTDSIPDIRTNEFNRSLRRLKWHYFKQIAEHRPGLYKFCRSLTGNPFDAEDLVQDSLVKAFAMHAASWHEIRNQRSFLFRIASNLWIDQIRKKSPELIDDWNEHPQSADMTQDTLEISDAIARLASTLPARERTTVLLKDVFDYKIEEIAEILVTSVPAVKAALHRGRQKLKGKSIPNSQDQPLPEKSDDQFLNKFQAAFNSHDVSACISMFMQTASAEVMGLGFEAGIDALKDGTLGQTFADKTISRIELRAPYGRKIFIVWHKEENGGESVRNVFEMLTQQGQCSHFSMYYFSPEFLAEISDELKLPFKTQGYGIP